jgi:hypothetical protein
LVKKEEFQANNSSAAKGKKLIKSRKFENSSLIITKIGCETVKLNLLEYSVELRHINLEFKRLSWPML